MNHADICLHTNLKPQIPNISISGESTIPWMWGEVEWTVGGSGDGSASGYPGREVRDRSVDTTIRIWARNGVPSVLILKIDSSVRSKRQF